MAKGWDHMRAGIRYTVRAKTLCYPATEEADDGPEIEAHYLAQFQEQDVVNALLDLDEYGEIEPLLIQVEQGNPYVMANPKAREVVAKALRGEGFKGGSGRKQAQQDIDLMRVIYLAVEYLKKYSSMPIFDREEAGRTACELVAKHANKSASTIRRRWKERQQVEQQRTIEAEKHGEIGIELLESYEAFRMFGNPLRIAHEAGNPPTPDEVVIWFLTGSFRDVERQDVLNELARSSLIEYFAVRVINNLKRSNRNRYGQLPL